MKVLTAVAPLSIVAMLALVPVAGARQSFSAPPVVHAVYPGTPVSTVVQPGPRLLATDQPVPLSLKVTWGSQDLMRYTWQAYVWPTGGSGPTLELATLTPAATGGGYFTGTLNAIASARWAAKAGTYWIGVLATPKPITPSPAPCPPLPTPEPTTSTPATAAQAACPFVSAVAAATAATAATPAAALERLPRSKVTVAPPLTLMWARYVARQKAYKIGWHSTAPLRCVAPYVPSAYTCTFRWHNGYDVLVKRSLTVTQDTTTGRVTVTRA